MRKIYNKTMVAYLYYQRVKPGKYDERAAQKQFLQDRKIDKKILAEILKEEHKAQLKEL